MRALTTTLAAAIAGVDLTPIYKVEIGNPVAYTYASERVLPSEYEESPLSQKATIFLDNTDGVLTALDLQGKQIDVSLGATTTAGDEYSKRAPLWIAGQAFDHDAKSGRFVCILTCIGIPNILAEDKAFSKYTPTDDDTYTVKKIFSVIATPSLSGTATYPTIASFSHCKDFTVVFDSEDALIDVYTPKSGLRIYIGSSRLALLRKLIDFTNCAMRFANDGKIHVFYPVTSVPSSETIRPDNAGDECNVTQEEGDACPNHYLNVDEVTSDEETTYIYEPSDSYCRDLYQASTISSVGAIASVTVYARASLFPGTAWRASLKLALKTGGTVYESDAKTVAKNWTNYSNAWTYNPKTGLKWTKADIDALQIGVSIRSAYTSPPSYIATDVTQVWAVITYGYDSAYTLASGGHPFFSKAYRKRIPIPNYVKVQTPPDVTQAYSGTAQDSSFSAGDPIKDKRQIELANIAAAGGDTQAALIATAILSKAQMLAEQGSAEVLLNPAAEIYDYVQVAAIDSSDIVRVGNIGTLRVKFGQGKWGMTMGFGGWETARGLLSLIETTPSGVGSADQFFTRLLVKDAYIENLQADNIDMTSVTIETIGEGTSPTGYRKVLSTHVDAGGIKLSSLTTFDTAN